MSQEQSHCMCCKCLRRQHGIPPDGPFDGRVASSRSVHLFMQEKMEQNLSIDTSLSACSSPEELKHRPEKSSLTDSGLFGSSEEVADRLSPASTKSNELSASSNSPKSSSSRKSEESKVIEGVITNSEALKKPFLMQRPQSVGPKRAMEQFSEGASTLLMKGDKSPKPSPPVIDTSDDADLARLERSRLAAQLATPAPSWKQKQMADRVHEDLELHIKQKPRLERGFGFLIRGGRELREPVTVSAVFAGSHADKAGIAVRDEILAVNGESAEDQSHTVVKKLIARAVDVGEVQLKLRRYKLKNEVLPTSPASTSPSALSPSSTTDGSPPEAVFSSTSSVVVSPFLERKRRPGRIENFVPDVERSSSASPGYRVTSFHENRTPGKISDFVPERDRNGDTHSRSTSALRTDDLPERKDVFWQRESEKVLGKLGSSSRSTKLVIEPRRKEPTVSTVSQPVQPVAAVRKSPGKPLTESAIPPGEKPPAPPADVPANPVKTERKSRRLSPPPEPEPDQFYTPPNYDPKTFAQKLNDAHDRLVKERMDSFDRDDDSDGEKDRSSARSSSGEIGIDDEICWSKMPLPGSTTIQVSTTSEHAATTKTESLDVILGRQNGVATVSETVMERQEVVRSPIPARSKAHSPILNGATQQVVRMNDERERTPRQQQTQSWYEGKDQSRPLHDQNRKKNPPPRDTKQVLKAPHFRGPSPVRHQEKNGDAPGAISVSGHQICSYCQKELGFHKPSTIDLAAGRGAAMIIESLHLFYHYTCFRCNVCGVMLGNGTQGTDVRVRNARLHCQSCYSNDETGIQFSEV